MFDLDLPETYATLDRSGIRECILDYPRQMREAYAAARALKLPAEAIASIAIVGMGDSALGAEIALAAVSEALSLPVSVTRGYAPPAASRGPAHVVIAVSHSGNSEETVAAFEAALARGCRVIALANGGHIAARAEALGLPLARCAPGGRFSATTGMAGLGVIGALAALGALADPDAMAAEACAAAEEANRMLGPDVPVRKNGCKRLAGQFATRLPILLGAGVFAPVARWWKIQLNSTAKLLALWEEMPEFNHGGMMVVDTLGQRWKDAMVVALRGNAEPPRIRLRHDLTARLMLEAGLNIDSARARGQSLLAQAFSLVAYGDWCAYYAAIMAGTDPAIYGTVPAMEQLKAGLSEG